MKKLLSLSVFTLLLVGIVFCFKPPLAHASSNSNLIDDGVFDNTNSMSAAQIDAWLNGFAGSCISPNNGFTAPDPTGYSPNANFVDGHYTYGSAVSAGRVIYDAAIAHGINPEVLLTKLQNEEQLVDGSAGCDNWRYTSAVGYACSDSGTNSHSYTYTGTDPYASGSRNLYTLNDSTDLVTPLYYRNGTPVNSITGSCVSSNIKAGFSQQVVHAAWFLSVYRHKAGGDVSWASVHGNWNHCEDNATCATALNIPDSWSCYSGPMTQGDFKLCSNDTTTHYFDGYITIDGSSVHMDTGATAALYYYTPHFQSFNSIFTNYFGSAYDRYSWSVANQFAYTDNTAGAAPVDLTNLLGGQTVYIGFQAKNTGDTTWTNSGNNPIHAGAVQPQDRASAFCDTVDSPAWLGCSRPANMTEASVAPGATGTFKFWYKAPAQSGTYDEHFSLVSEGLKWMNDPGLYFHTVVKPPIYTWSVANQYAYTDQTKTTPVDLTNLAPGQKVYIGFQAKNTGNVSWINSGSNPVHAGTNNPLDRTSPFCDLGDSPAWLGCNRPANMTEATVAPGATGKFEFWYQAPASAGIFHEYFRPVVEGVTWMNDTGMNFYTVVHFDPSGGSTLSSNQSLAAGQYITSGDGRYRLVMQGDGNLVLYSISRPLWSTNTAGRPVTRAVMQGDGNLVLYDAQNKPYWASNTAGRGTSNLVVQSDGNLVVYDSGNHPTWASRTNGQF